MQLLAQLVAQLATHWLTAVQVLGPLATAYLGARVERRRLRRLERRVSLAEVGVEDLEHASEARDVADARTPTFLELARGRR